MEIPLRDRTDPALRVIETMLWLPDSGPVRGDRHLARAQRTCEVLGFAYDPAEVHKRLFSISSDTPQRVRLTFDLDGEVGMTRQPFTLGSSPEKAMVGISGVRLDPEEPFLRIKTTRRTLYDRTLKQKAAELYDVLFFNTRGELCEGAFTNVFLQLDGQMVTPALSSGLLPGILREQLLVTGECREAVLDYHDLMAAEALWVGNSLRGLIPAAVA
ncbi:hypothetical protein GCM10011415_08130 [Salipiger pallidus]|uniref:Probable branched-chain-amino-acid aminotransferase n=1 Tax=Salipiger pallidus TaxID=1775170 RepID=A0A8J3EG08_9RHOB|nr:aminotransferase class IV family protein [Salipiger pallidus]GGG64010.1 hypothetical protein GCM10011415_08130 [Salipiger pallidus]